MAWTIGILGMIHDHVWHHVPELAGRDDVTLAVADPNEPLREKARAEFGVERTYGDYADLLERERPDAVLIFVDNASHAPLVELVAAHGKPMMVEKPMADSLANAERMRVAANKAGVPLMINWPTAWLPTVRHALRLAVDGTVGDVYRLNFRGGHGGPKEYGCTPYFYDWLYDRSRNGAGAYIDYGGYGATMARLVLGLPNRAYATIGRLQKDYVAVDDNGTLVLRYPRAMALVEMSWTAAGPVPAGSPMIAGNRGTLTAYLGRGRREGQVSRGGTLELITPEKPDGTLLDVPDLPVGQRSAVEYFLSCLERDQPFEGMLSATVSRDAQEILEAGLRSAQDGREVSLPLDNR
jgi:predicted dehydrogenase